MESNDSSKPGSAGSDAAARVVGPQATRYTLEEARAQIEYWSTVILWLEDQAREAKLRAQD
jgi:hypothetical protein